MSEPYHRFVYDEERRVLVGAFEEMYAHEEVEGYDSWHQEELGQNWRKLALALINGCNAESILDIGCGKGAFTSQLRAGRIVGMDVSETALEKARARVPAAEFRCARAEDVGALGDRFDLAVCLEILSYVEDWRAFLHDLAGVADRLFLSLYLPPDVPIGFVKSFDDLRSGVSASWSVVCDTTVLDREVRGSQVLLLAVSLS